MSFISSLGSYFKQAATVLLLLIVIMSVAACGKKPVYLLADVGSKLAPVAAQAQDVVLEADRSGLQPNKDLTAKAMANFKKLGATLQQLAAALRVYDTLDGNGKEQQAVTIRQLLAEARQLTRAVMVFTGGNEKLGAQLNQTFDNLERLFDAISNGLAPLPPSAVPQS